MKKIILIFFILILGNSFGQTNSTGTINLSSTFGLEYTAQIDITPSIVTLTLIGPSDRWLGLGFGASSMAANKDVVIFTGSALTDRTFAGTIEPTLDANQDWTITSNTITSGKRTLVATRALNTGEANDYIFDTSDTSINLVWARGIQSKFSLAYHGSSNRGITSSSLSLGVNDNELAYDFKMFPNPASSKLKITLPSTAQYANLIAFDILGNKIFNKSMSNLNPSIDVSSWKQGVYLVRISSEGKTKTKRFIKQ